MALGTMKNKRSVVSTAPEILYNDDKTTMAITLDESAFSDGVCKSGTPIGEGGVIANSASAKGVLWGDVFEERPQGTIIIGGYINTAVAQEHSGVTIAAEAQTAMKNVVFM